MRKSFDLVRPSIAWTGRAGMLAGGALAALLWAAPAARANVINVIDIIPNGDSAEVGQNSEPSLAVDPLNPDIMIAGAFSTLAGSQVNSPYWRSSNGGTTWADFGSLLTIDKSIAWEQSGAAALTTTLNRVSGTVNEINTFQSGATNFGSSINPFNPGKDLDQPWIRTGPSGQTYVTYNNLSNFGTKGGKTASIIVSANNGSTYAAPITLETVSPGGGQDAPSVRSAVNGNTIYAVFTRWGGVIENDGNGKRFGNSQIVVVKSTNSGASFSAGVAAATATGYFANKSNTALTLGQQRTGSDVAIAVDANNANHVVVAYGDAPGANGSGLLQLHVIESTDGGATWAQKFTTAAAVRSGLPALSILSNGTIGLLYTSYDPAANQLSQHFLTTRDDFATTGDTLLGKESNATPTLQFFPYVGDFQDLTSVGDTFDGIFSASNADNGTDALYASATFQRDFTGTPGTASFLLTNGAGGGVNFSIDPFFFSATVPEPSTLPLLGTAVLALIVLQAAWRRRA